MGCVNKYPVIVKCLSQAGAELGQAQLKLGLDFTSGTLHSIDEHGILIARVSNCKEPLPTTEHNLLKLFNRFT